MQAKSPKEIKRDLILDAALKVFSEKGYHNATMNEIATAAGIGKGTIYEYFASKIQLFQQMLARGLYTYFESLEMQNLRRKTVEEMIHSLLEGHILFCRQHSRLTRLVFWDTQVQDDEVKDWMLQMRKEKEARLQKILEEGIASGELRQQDPYIMTLVVTGVIASIWAPLVLDGWDIETNYLADAITDVIMWGIRNQV